jgi:hypothetical protein
MSERRDGTVLSAVIATAVCYKTFPNCILYATYSNNNRVTGWTSHPMNADSRYDEPTAGQFFTHSDHSCLCLQDGQTEASCSLNILNDTAPEDTEYVYVFLTALSSGATVARPSVNNGLQVRFVASLMAMEFLHDLTTSVKYFLLIIMIIIGLMNTN